MVESLSNNADKSDVDAEVEDHRATEVHDQPQPPDGKGEPGGVAELDDNGAVRSGQVPSLAVTDTFTVTNESDLTNLNAAEIGDVGIVTSQSRSYILTGDYSSLSNWTEFESPPAPVDDVNGQTGSVSLGAADVSAEPSGAVEDHRQNETHATAQPAQTHGNEDHNVTFAQDGDSQPPENHGNGAHSANYLDSNDYTPESDTHSRYTDGEARTAVDGSNVSVGFADSAGDADTVDGQDSSDLGAPDSTQSSVHQANRIGVAGPSDGDSTQSINTTISEVWAVQDGGVLDIDLDFDGFYSSFSVSGMPIDARYFNEAFLKSITWSTSGTSQRIWLVSYNNHSHPI